MLRRKLQGRKAGFDDNSKRGDPVSVTVRTDDGDSKIDAGLGNAESKAVAKPTTSSRPKRSKRSKFRQPRDVRKVLIKPSAEYLQTFNEGRALEAVVLGAEEDALDQLGVKAPLSESDSSDVETSKLSYVKPTRKPAWQDDDDAEEATTSVDVLRDSRYRKLAKVGETKIKRNEYEQRLKRKFEEVMGTPPSWADLEQTDVHRRSEDEDEEEKELSRRTGDYVSRSSRRLERTYLQYKPVCHANKALLHKATVSTVRFHPTSQVIMTAGKDQNLSFFQVDGVRNAKIESLHIENYPIYCARFTADGNQVVLGSRHKAFYEYDMMSARLTNIQPIKALDNQPMSFFEMSPCGQYIAFRGEYGYIYILSTKSKELVCMLKMNGSVNCMTFSPNGEYLYTFGDDAEVYIWEMKSRQCIHRFRDEGCLKGTSICTDQELNKLVCGSDIGVVNIYNVSDCMQKVNPTPVKVINNLVTQCTSAMFNSSAQVLALASETCEKAVKLVSMDSLSVYQNFPSMIDKMAKPTALDFSPNSGYLATGTNKGIVHMYRLEHFRSY